MALTFKTFKNTTKATLADLDEAEAAVAKARERGEENDRKVVALDAELRAAVAEGLDDKEFDRREKALRDAERTGRKLQIALDLALDRLKSAQAAHAEAAVAGRRVQLQGLAKQRADYATSIGEKIADLAQDIRLLNGASEKIAAIVPYGADAGGGLLSPYEIAQAIAVEFYRVGGRTIPGASEGYADWGAVQRGQLATLAEVLAAANAHLLALIDRVPVPAPAPEPAPAPAPAPAVPTSMPVPDTQAGAQKLTVAQATVMATKPRQKLTLSNE